MHGWDMWRSHQLYTNDRPPDLKPDIPQKVLRLAVPMWCPGETSPTVSRTDHIHGTLYGFFGMEDQSIPLNPVNEIEQMLQHHQIDHQIFRYPDAGHGFFCDQRGRYNKTAAADAWTHVQTLFQTLA